MIKIIQILRASVHSLTGVEPCCRFQPTCSQYYSDAVKAHGLIKGSTLFVVRVLRCHPLGSYGYDPVPKEKY